MLILWVALFLAFLWIFFPMGPSRTFQKYETRVHPYSGLDPVSWQRFLTNIRGFEKVLESDLDKSTEFLYHAIENIRDLGLGIRTSTDGAIQETLQGISNELGLEGELKINQTAIRKGLRFFPRYLNETFDDYPEDGYFIPSTVRSHGQ